VKARLITRFKDVRPEDGVIELVLWHVPEPLRPSGHGFKYRAAHAIDGVRVVGFDNERSKGDHCRVTRDVRRVHDHVEVLAALGLFKRTDSGGVVCPFDAVHIDMRLTAPHPLAA